MVEIRQTFGSTCPKDFAQQLGFGVLLHPNHQMADYYSAPEEDYDRVNRQVVGPRLEDDASTTSTKESNSRPSQV